MDANKFYEEYENLKDTRLIEGWNSFKKEVFRDTDRYEDFITELEDIALDYGLDGDDTESRASAVFEALIEDPENFDLAYEVLDVAVELEMDDYFGTEGLDI